MIRHFIKSLFSIIGLDVFLFKKRNIHDYDCLDKNMMEWYFHNSDERQLYVKAMHETNMEWSDNFVKQCRHYTLQKLLKYVISKKLDGDVAECGCWKGTSIYQLADNLSKSDSVKKLHVFDSFEGGLSEKVNEDENARLTMSSDQVTHEKLIFQSTEDEVKHNLRDYAFVNYYAGWIPERFYEVSGTSFCFVHIDVDLYEPTRDSLNFFHERLVSGGVIVVDDYGYTQFPGAKKAVDQFLEINSEYFFMDSPTGGCYLIRN